MCLKVLYIGALYKDSTIIKRDPDNYTITTTGRKTFLLTGKSLWQNPEQEGAAICHDQLVVRGKKKAEREREDLFTL